MYVRLAFAVAINVTPDILVVDEALSVGDEAFQRKCFARINRMRDDGATVLFVSHSAGIVTQLCDRAVLLDQGELLLSGTPKFVVSRYHKMLYAPAERAAAIREQIRGEVAHGEPVESEVLMSDSDRQDARLVETAGESRPHELAQHPHEDWFDEGMSPTSTVRYDARGVQILDPHLQAPDGRRVNVLRAGSDYLYVYRVAFENQARRVRFGMLIKTVTGLELGGGVSAMEGGGLQVVEAGDQVEVRFRFRCLLAPGTYFLNAGVQAEIDGEETYVDRLIDAAMFRVLPEPQRLATGIVDFCTRPLEPRLLDG